jgi:hypothetical protein
MHIEGFEFGSIRIDGDTFDHDVVLQSGRISERKKKPSKPYKGLFGHTPLSTAEDIPWKCNRLVIGTGAYGRMPVMDEVREEAQRRGVELVILPTREAIDEINLGKARTNAILHVTC